jgi:hypothetical protein
VTLREQLDLDAIRPREPPGGDRDSAVRALLVEKIPEIGYVARVMLRIRSHPNERLPKRTRGALSPRQAATITKRNPGRPAQ